MEEKIEKIKKGLNMINLNLKEKEIKNLSEEDKEILRENNIELGIKEDIRLNLRVSREEYKDNIITYSNEQDEIDKDRRERIKNIKRKKGSRFITVLL